MSVRILIGDCRERMKDLPDASVDSVVCDPPYHLTSIVKRFGSATAAPAKVGKTGAFARASKGFMGQTWDGGDVAFQPETWAEVLRVLTPGGHLVAFSGTRTYHRMAVAIEDAGFEIRDQLAWLYGSGFPKSLDVSKAIDKQRDDKPDIHRVCAFVAAGRDAAAKANREIDALFGFNGMAGHWTNSKGPQAQVPRWEQWLKLRAFLSLSDEMDAEVWRLNGRKGKPGENWKVIGEREAGAATGGVYGTYAQRVEINDPTESAQQWRGWGTALKPSWEPICLARKPLDGTVANNVLTHGTGALNIDGCRIGTEVETWPKSRSYAPGQIQPGGKGETMATGPMPAGRWPANLCLSYPEDEYLLKSTATVEQRRELYGWLSENA